MLRLLADLLERLAKLLRGSAARSAAQQEADRDAASETRAVENVERRGAAGDRSVHDLSDGSF